MDPHAAAEALTYQVLCRKACELGATRIATEHTLVDEATGLFKKFLGMDVGELAREHSWERVGEAYSSQAMKVRPLIEVSDEEVRLYARVCGIKYAVLEGPCRVPPYDPVRKHLLEIELDRVGNMLNIVRRFHKVFMPLIEPFAQQSGGVVCGETDGARSLDKALLESLIPLNDVSGDEDQAVPCAKCRLLGGVSPNGLCRACTVLESVANCSTGAITDETAPASVCKVIFKGNGDEEEEYKFFISTDVRGIRAKKKDRLKDDTNVTVSN